MSAIGDPLGLMGRMIGQFKVGEALPGAPSGLLYRGWDMAAQGATGERAPVWLQFCDTHYAASGFAQNDNREALMRQIERWRAFAHERWLPIVGCEIGADHPPVIAMRAGTGKLLTALIDQSLDAIASIKLVIGIGDVLSAAHDRGLVHLGICDESILLSDDHYGAPVVLSALGIPSHFDRGDLSRWHYLAPEQIACSSEVDARADTFALGVLLHRCITGDYPVPVNDGLSADKRIAKILFGDRRDPRPRLDVVPRDDLASIIERAICRDRAKRYPSCAAFVDALRRWIAPPSEIPREASDPAGNCVSIVAPSSSAPAIRAAPDERTLSPTPAPNAKQSAVTVGGKLRLVTPIDADATTRTDPLIGTMLGDLRIVERIGQGGWSTVYLAKHNELGRSWAVKVGDLDFAADARRRFLQEVHVTAQLREAGELRVPEVRNHGTLDDGRPYMVIEYVRGQTLATLLQKTPKLPLDQALKIVARVCDTLERAHNLGFTHRDIKPENIMIEVLVDREKLKIRVIDWGVAKASGDAKQAATRSGMIVGTPGFMPAEAIVGNPVDGRADVFAVACCLYEMLTGRRAFQGADPDTVTRATLTDEPPAPSSLRPGIPADVDDLIRVGLVKLPDQRPTMAMFRERLERIMRPTAPKAAPSGRMDTLLSTSNPKTGAPLSQRPTLAPADRDSVDFMRRVSSPPGPTRQMPRPARHRGIAVAVALTLLTALGVIAGMRLAASRPTASATSEPTLTAPPTAVAAQPAQAPIERVVMPSPPVLEPVAPVAVPAHAERKHRSRAPLTNEKAAQSKPVKSEPTTAAPSLETNPNALAPLSE